MGGVLMAAAINPRVLTQSKGGSPESDKAELVFELGLGRWGGDCHTEMGRGGQRRRAFVLQGGKIINKETA